MNSKGRAESLAQDPQLFWVHLPACWGAVQNLFFHNHNNTLSQSSSCALRSSKRFARSVFWALGSGGNCSLTSTMGIKAGCNIFEGSPCAMLQPNHLMPDPGPCLPPEFSGFGSPISRGSTVDPQGLRPLFPSRPFKPREAPPAIPYLQGHTLGPDAG